MRASQELKTGFAAAGLGVVLCFGAASSNAAESHGSSKARPAHPAVVGVVAGPTVIVETERVVYQRPQPAAPAISPAAACPTLHDTYVDGMGVSHSQVKRPCF